MKAPTENKFGTFVLLSMVAVAIYATVLFSGAFIDHYQVKLAVRAAHSRARRDSDEILRAQLLRGSLSEVGTHWEGSANLQEVNGLGLSEQDIVIKRDEKENVLIRINYERRIRLKPSDQFVTLTFKAEEGGIPP